MMFKKVKKLKNQSLKLDDSAEQPLDVELVVEKIAKRKQGTNLNVV